MHDAFRLDDEHGTGTLDRVVQVGELAGIGGDHGDAERGVHLGRFASRGSGRDVAEREQGLVDPALLEQYQETACRLDAGWF
ncbi:hypothetical protein Lesp02_44830 [Lentzea sp. NBRC 105346]|nr:hypothetical protein Lesp02_44830 [Lentzea sp. NBRC 105346]